ncbi:hypothetical protein [Helicobacter cetorum]|nr:hypothetical protein [Helicobacter cetorum]
MKYTLLETEYETIDVRTNKHTRFNIEHKVMKQRNLKTECEMNNDEK